MTRRVFPVSLLALAAACGGASSSDDRPLVVYAAGSLARPLGAVADSFTAQSGVRVSLEPAGSLDLARRVTELGQVPDVIALADEDVFPKLLLPTHVQWYARFARNRMVVARAKGRPSIHGATPWWETLQRAALQVGRADPDLDPGGYRALMVFQLAERQHGVAGLADRLLGNAPRRNVRPKSAELVALLQAGELDYAWMYESSARGARLDFDTLDAAIDLSREADSTSYQQSLVKVAGARAGDTLEVRGAPIRYGISIPLKAARHDVALQFVRYLVSDDGRRILQREFLDALEEPLVVGAGAPPLKP